MILWILITFRYLFIGNTDDLDTDVLFGLGLCGLMEFIGECALLAHIL